MTIRPDRAYLNCYFLASIQYPEGESTLLIFLNIGRWNKLLRICKGIVIITSEITANLPQFQRHQRIGNPKINLVDLEGQVAGSHRDRHEHEKD